MILRLIVWVMMFLQSLINQLYVVMEARKVHDRAIVRVITFYPEHTRRIVSGFPGCYIVQSWEEPNANSPSNFFIWVRTPNEEVASKLGTLMRSIPTDEITNDD